ncbi:hypothetical protein EGH21_19160 [Halomicroarcula sp. F13]|uniref:DUF624 domain-containing protein n=1 Tax=Haloarcula rubra TaxID=2487747 RepID=A0AAW4PV35_9EURY|nr:DUF624 domain-containing protein [Halomicroarcula rubra]MBX0325150.1 hypothetical protein [Halomicroarcula rubra]
MTSRPTLDPVGTLAAFGRAAYSDLTSVVALSLVFSLATLPLVTLGPAVVALVAAQTEGVTGRAAGGKVTERDRLRVFRTTFREQFRRGLPLGVFVLAVAVTTIAYAGLAVANRSGPLLVGAILGGYALSAALVTVLRAATLLVREGAPSARQALWDAGRHLLSTPSFSVLHALFASLLVVLCLGLGIAAVLLLPGLLAVLEVVAYEETAGDGALRVVRAYQGTLRTGGGS